MLFLIFCIVLAASAIILNYEETNYERRSKND